MQRVLLKTKYRSTFPDIQSGFLNRHSPQIKVLLFSLSDLIFLSFSLGAVILARSSIEKIDVTGRIFEILLFMLVAWCFFLIAGLYRSGISPVQELRHLTIAITVFFLALAGFSPLFHDFGINSRIYLFFGLLLALFLIPLGREITRGLFSRHRFWNEPVVVIGFGPSGYEIAEYLVDNPRSGLFPIVVVDRRTTDRGKPPRVPVVRASDILEHPEMVDLFKSIPTAILVTNEINEEFLDLILEERILRFRELIIVSNSPSISNLWARPFMIGEMLGFKIGQNLLSSGNRRIKRIFDLVVVVLTIPITLPLYLLFAMLIKLNSPGEVRQKQMKLGFQNRFITVPEFRTTYIHSKKRTAATSQKTTGKPANRSANIKPEESPQLTPIGSYLLSSGLVHLPQLVNVIKGEMSLIGPAPILQEETKFFGQLFPLYCSVLPGITGLWQISNQRYQSQSIRVHLDEHYIRNWSLWQDYYILFRSFLKLFSGQKRPGETE